jgi:hypothetical protein
MELLIAMSAAMAGGVIAFYQVGYGRRPVHHLCGRALIALALGAAAFAITHRLAPVGEHLGSDGKAELAGRSRA